MSAELAALRLLVEWGADEALADEAANLLTASASFTVPADAREATPGLLQPGIVPATPAWVSHPQPLPAPARTPAQAATVLAASAATLDVLHLAMDGFNGCPLRATATHTVRPSGAPGAELVLIAEAPGADDDRTGQAFAGAPGRMLDQVLASIGVDRSGVLLTHLVPWRPPGNRAPNEGEIQACLPFLHRLLSLTRPARILLAGAGPGRALAGTADGVRRLRGRWLPVAIEGQDTPAQALLLPPIDQWLRSSTAKQALWADLLELRRNLGKSV